MKIQIKNLFSFLIFAFLLFFFSTNNVAAIGISPAKVEIKNILPKQPQSRKITFFKNKKDIDKKITYKIIKEENYIDVVDEIVIDKGEQSTQFNLTINAKKLKKGKYKTMLSLMEQKNPEQDNKPSVSVNVGIRLEIAFSVTNKIIREYKVSNVRLEKKDDKIFLAYNIFNQGNIVWNPKRMKLALERKYSRNEKYKFDNNIDDDDLFVNPGLARRLYIELDSDLLEKSDKIYTYQAKLKFFGEKIIASNNFKARI